MNNIDTISYSATSTDATTGYITYVQAQYFVPFFDYFLVYSVFTFTVFIAWFIYYIFKRKIK